jgi:hypothetical protein
MRFMPLPVDCEGSVGFLDVEGFVPVDFALLQRIALPINVGAVRYPGIKIHDVRVIRLLEMLLHGGTHVGCWSVNEIHDAVLASFHLSANTYGLNRLRYDLRKLKGHGLIERDGARYAYRLTSKGVQVALLFLFFHKRFADRSPTAASTIAPIHNAAPTAASKRPITAPTKPSNTSWNCSPPLDNISPQSRTRY